MMKARYWVNVAIIISTNLLLNMATCKAAKTWTNLRIYGGSVQIIVVDCVGRIVKVVCSSLLPLLIQPVLFIPYGNLSRFNTSPVHTRSSFGHMHRIRKLASFFFLSAIIVIVTMRSHESLHIICNVQNTYSTILILRIGHSNRCTGQ